MSLRGLYLLPVLVACLAAASPLVAQVHGRVIGTILDDDHEPLAGVTVRLRGAARSAVTGEDGAFEFCSVTPGAYQFVATRGGLVVDCGDIDVNGSWITTIYLQLDVSSSDGSVRPMLRVESEPDRTAMGSVHVIGGGW